MVANDVVLPVDRETAWELLTDQALRREWLGEEWQEREAILEHAERGVYLAWWWDDGRHGSRVEVILTDAVGGTRISVTEQPVARAHGAGLRVSDVFAALGDPTRRGILEAVAARGEMTATELAGELPISRQAVAKHLGVLQDAGLVSARRAGRETRYLPTPAPLGDAIGWMTTLGSAWDDRLAALAAAAAARTRP